VLLNKLEQYGIVGRFKALIKSYLTEIYQRVIIQNNSKSSYSDWKMIKHGVPQGFILGPLCFYYYKVPAPNELEKYLNGFIC
jgi:hypothetical protein